MLGQKLKWVAVALALAACQIAAAEGYSSRQVKIVVPFAAGSGSGVYARLIADDFRAAFNQTFLIENKAGASAQVGSLQVAKSVPDGYTLLTATNTGQSGAVQEAGLRPGGRFHGDRSHSLYALSAGGAQGLAMKQCG